jgi:hypothetical protein
MVCRVSPGACSSRPRGQYSGTNGNFRLARSRESAIWMQPCQVAPRSAFSGPMLTVDNRPSSVQRLECGGAVGRQALPPGAAASWILAAGPLPPGATASWISAAGPLPPRGLRHPGSWRQGLPPGAAASWISAAGPLPPGATASWILAAGPATRGCGILDLGGRPLPPRGYGILGLGGRACRPTAPPELITNRGRISLTCKSSLS